MPLLEIRLKNLSDREFIKALLIAIAIATGIERYTKIDPELIDIDRVFEVMRTEIASGLFSTYDEERDELLLWFYPRSQEEGEYIIRRYIQEFGSRVRYEWLG